LVRGATYYIADGTYGGYDFDDSEDGNKYIFIKKATISEHGTDIGWNNSYGDGQALFTEPTELSRAIIIKFKTGYYIFDGIKGAGDNEPSYGFILQPSECEKSNYLLGIPWMGEGYRKLTYITISHTAFVLCGEEYNNYIQQGIYSSPYSGYTAEHLTISHNYFIGGSTNLIMRRWKNCIIENKFFGGNWSSSSFHGAQVVPGIYCDDIIFRNNIATNSRIFVVDFHQQSGDGSSNSRWMIYNNIVIGGDVVGIWANGDSGYYDVVKSCYVHHNTYINVNIGGEGAVYPGKLTDPATDRSYAYNNLFYNCRNANFENYIDGTDNVIHDYNAFFKCTGTVSEEDNGQEGTINPFVDSDNGDFHLAIDINPGVNLGAPYNIDRDGNIRTNWSPGAYEYITGANILSASTENRENFHIYPNPFTYTATIEYTLPEGSDVGIILYDLTGRKIENLYSGHQSSGIHTLNIDAGDLSKGVYFCRIKTELYDLARKCIILE